LVKGRTGGGYRKCRILKKLLLTVAFIQRRAVTRDNRDWWSWNYLKENVQDLFQRTAHIISTGEKEIPQLGNFLFGPIYLCHVARCKATCVTRM